MKVLRTLQMRYPLPPPGEAGEIPKQWEGSSVPSIVNSLLGHTATSHTQRVKMFFLTFHLSLT